MNADMMVLTYIGGLCALALLLAPLFLLLQIARDVRKIRDAAHGIHADSTLIREQLGQWDYEKHHAND